MDTNQPVPETRGQIVRCIFESLALRYRQVLDDLRGLASQPIETLIPVVAGPSEATALGNVMMQAMAIGEAADVPGMRKLIHNSIPLKTYQPQNMENWGQAYIHFKNIVS